MCLECFSATYSKISIMILMLSQLLIEESPLVLFKSANITRIVPICGTIGRTLQNHLNNITTALIKFCCIVINLLSLITDASTTKKKQSLQASFYCKFNTFWNVNAFVWHTINFLRKHQPNFRGYRITIFRVSANWWVIVIGFKEKCTRRGFYSNKIR